MAQVVPFDRTHLEQLASLVNAHISSVVPGWALPAPFIAERLERDPDEYVIGPWVAERATLVALERDRVVAAVHLHRYDRTARVGPAYRDVGEIAWLVAWPDAAEGARLLLEAALEQLDAWEVAQTSADLGLAPGLGGLADCWPHLAAALREAGFDGPQRTEAIWAGRLETVPSPKPPLEGLELRRGVANLSTRFEALLDGQGVGIFDVASDLTEGGALPALHGWCDVWNFHVVEEHRSQGIGGWLVGQAASWLRLGGCKRIALTVASEDDAAGAGRFYERLGWRPLAVLERGWHRASSSRRSATSSGRARNGE